VSDPGPPARLATLTTGEAGERLGPGTVLFLPVGSTEAHGPHLTLETDVLLAQETARRAGAALAALGTPSLLLPPLPYARAACAAGFPGTVSVGSDTLRALVVDIARATAPAGGPLLCVVNGHLEPEHVRCLRRAVEEARAEGCRVVFGDQTRRPWVDRLGEEFRQGGGHAGGYETSLTLAAGGRVDEARRDGLPPIPLDLGQALRDGPADFRALGDGRGYFGDPAGATREAGDRLYGVLVEAVLDAISAGDRSS